MSLFGAATSGVDPKTGSYLNKEQRIAMFRASQGRGGAGGGSRKDERRGVDPQSSIVVVNKMSGMIQTLQTTFQESTTAVNQQVEQNRRDIENLYKLIAEERKQELKEEKLETQTATKDKENLLRGARERLVEGLSSAVAGATRAVGSVAKKAAEPAMGLFQRLLKTLGLLAGAWALDNIDLILDKIQEWKQESEDLPEKLKEKALETRGVWSVFDRIFGGLKRAIGNLARRVFRIGQNIFRRASKIGRKIFTKIGSFIRKVVTAVLSRIGSFVQKAYSRLINGLKALRPPKPNTQTPKTPNVPDPPKPKATTPDVKPGTGSRSVPGDEPAKPKADAKPKPKPKNWLFQAWDNVSDTFKKTVGGGEQMVKESPEVAEKAAKEADGVVKPSTKKTVVKIFEPLSKLGSGGKNAAGRLINTMMGTLGNVLKKIPWIGSLIDTILNLIAGQNPVEAVVRGLASGTGGAIGWAGGAAIGGKIGLIGGSVVPGIGNAIGAGLGALIGGLVGSMLAGAIGDEIGATAYEAFTGEKRTDNKVLGSEIVKPVTDLITNPGNKTAEAITEEKGKQTASVEATLEGPVDPKPDYKVNVNTSGNIFDFGAGSSTPEGMQLDSVSDVINGVQSITLPEQVFDMRNTDNNTQNVEEQVVPFFPSFNPEMNIYKEFSEKEYQLLPLN